MTFIEGDAASAVTHRGGHIQIIAAAGSGKTEVVSQRVADLIATDVKPRSIVAFTFTEKAAAELKERSATGSARVLGFGVAT
ncbi:UvrD-helicase domain-containing protein [Microbacterium sp. NPDC076911]|uniref:UvrD-helicase domain-containing protein n=1 Tax=Microbacterium sp. NPDC076911 TaxID=3154958 RepID=UPI00342F3303